MFVTKVDGTSWERDLQPILFDEAHDLKEQVFLNRQVFDPNRGLGEAVDLNGQTEVAELREVNEMKALVDPFVLREELP